MVGLLGGGSSLGALHGDGPGDVAAQQGNGAGQVHDAAANAGDQHGHGESAEQTPAGDRDVDLLDVGRVGVADELEKIAEVVRDEGVARPLGEETKHGGDEHTAAHTSGLEEIGPRPLAGLHLELDGGRHLGELGRHELVAAVTLAVVLLQNVAGLLCAVLGNEPAGRLGQEEDEADLEKRGANLKERGNAPRPIVGDVVGAEADGGGDNLPDEVGDVEKRGHDGALLGVRQLTDERRARDNAGRDAEAENHAGNDVHADVLSETLNEGTHDHDAGASEDGPAAAKLVVDDGDEGQRQNGTEGVSGSDNALERTHGVAHI